MIDAEQKATNIKWHNQGVTREELETLHGHRGASLWFTGLPSAGKSTIANAVARRLHEMKVSTMVLDGDNVRHGLNKNLGFSPEDRVENIRRIGELAKLFTDAGIVNLNAFISPFQEDRDFARQLQPERFFEVHCDADLSLCESRDPKGYYNKARAGIIKNFTGIDAPYEVPENPEIYLNTGTMSPEECVSKVVDVLRARGIVE